MKKITKKEMFTLIKEAMADNSEVVEFCEKEIASIEKKAEKAKEYAAKKKQEDTLKEVVFGALTSDFQTIPEILEKLDGQVEASASMITYRLTKLIEEGAAKKEMVSVEGIGGKKTKKSAYALA